MWFSGTISIVLLAIQPVIDSGETGTPYLQNFSPEIYNAHVQNWAIRQDDDGFLYFGNRSGFLRYDGTNWNLTPTPDNRVVFSLSRFSEDRFFVGLEKDFGVLEKDQTGQMHYHSLAHKLPEQYEELGDVRSMVLTDDEVVLFSDVNHLYSYDGNRITKLNSDIETGRLQRAHEQIYLLHPNHGLSRYNENHFEALPLFNEDRVLFLHELSRDTVLVGLEEKGLFKWINNEFIPFAGEYNDLLLEFDFNNIVVSDEGFVVVGTRHNGVLIYNPDENLQLHLNHETGLPGNSIYSMGQDYQGGLWIGHNRGLTRITLPPTLMLFDQNHGLLGLVENVTRHRGTLFTSGLSGVFKWTGNHEQPDASSFVPVEGLQDYCFELLSTETDLLAACASGVSAYNEGIVRQLMDLQSAIVLSRSVTDPDLVYVGTTDGLYLMRFRDGMWTNQGRFSGVNGFIRHIVEDKSGDVWIATRLQGLQRIRHLHTPSQEPDVIEYSVESGLPEGRYRVFYSYNEILVATSEGIHTFDGEGSFSRDTRFQDTFPDDSQPIRMATGPDQTVWLSTGSITGKLTEKDDGRYGFKRAPVRGLPYGITYAVYPDSEDRIWFGGMYGLASLKYGEELIDTHPELPPLNLHTVEMMQRNERLSLQQSGHPVFSHTENHLRFRYILVNYNEDPIEYRYKLTGFDEGWSTWSPIFEKEYTNLPGNDYRFNIQARIAEGETVDAVSYTFTIRPPWYASTYAIIFWVLLGGFGIFGLVRWRVYKLEEKNRRLEGMILERTAEIREQKQKIEQQADKLAELDRMKTRFFSNISHEFRTPLTLIQGPLEDLNSGLYGQLNMKQRENTELALHNSRKLLHLINQLLELNKLETGNVHPELKELDIISFLRGIVDAFLPLAERQEITLSFEPDYESLTCSIDPDKFEKIMANLLSNAFKATDAGDKIKVKAGISQIDKKSQLRIDVEDTGRGISPDKLPTLFDRFTQAGKQAATGTGIGLNLTQEFVRMHDGTIDVESKKSESTRFTVQIPIRHSDTKLEKVTASSDLSITSVQTDNSATGPSADRQEDITTVLIIDDNPDIRRYVCNRLEGTFRVIEAENGKAGFEAAKSELPDMIVSDVMMPEMDGYELSEKLGSDPETDSIPLILLTAKASEKSKIEGLQTGADDYLTKPFNADELLLKVKNLIDSRKKLKEKYSGEMTIPAMELEIVSEEKQFMKLVLQSISDNLSEEKFSTEDLAAAVNLSSSQLQRRIKSAVNLTPNQLIRKTRLTRAAQLLDNNTATVSEIAYSVGFSSLSYFSRVFRNEFGLSPTDYQNREQKA